MKPSMSARPPRGCELRVAHGVEVLELLGEARDDPREAPGPGGERRVALLRVRAPVAAVDDVEDRLVGHPAADVPGVAALPVVHRVPGRGPGVLHEAGEQRHARVVLLEQHVAETVGDGERPEAADGVREQRVRAVEGVDEPAAVHGAGPAPGLDRARHLQRQLVEAALPGARPRSGPRARRRRRLPYVLTLLNPWSWTPTCETCERHALHRGRPAHARGTRRRRQRRTGGWPTRTGSPGSTRSSPAKSSGRPR